MREHRRSNQRSRVSGARAPSDSRPLKHTSSASPAEIPRWFYGLCAVAIVTAVLLPYPPVKYLILLVFGLVFLSFYSTAPERTVLVLIIGLPVLDIVPDDIIPVPGLNAETLVILALAVAVVSSRSQQPRPLVKNPLVLPVLYYSGVLVFSALHGHLSGVARIWDDRRGGEWLTWDAVKLFSVAKNYFFFVFLAPLTFRLAWRPQFLRSALHLMAITTTLVSLHAIWGVRAVLLRGSPLERHRPDGLIGDQENLFSAFLAMMIAIFVSVFLSRASSKKEKLLFLGAIAAAAPALLFTLSRGAWVAVTISLMLLALLRGAKAIGFVLLAAVLVVQFVPHQVIDRIEMTTGEAESVEGVGVDVSAAVRVNQWRTLPEMWQEAPILGHGFKSFQYRWYQFGLSHKAKAAHSTFVEFAVEEGLAGLVAYAWLLWSLAAGAVTLIRRSDNSLHRDLSFGFLCALVGLVIMDLSGTRFTSRDVMAYIWILGGALARIASSMGSEQTVQEPGRAHSLTAPRRRGPLPHGH